MQISDSFITIVFTLFVASTVNERIIDFIKLYFPKFGLKSLRPQAELKRFRRLWLLAFAMGVLTTLLLDINLVSLLISYTKNDKMEGMMEWLIKNKDNIIVLLWGYLFTALFISLGSKFWHDLLDLVLYVKNGRQKIKNFNPHNITDQKQIESYLSENEFMVAQKALEANRTLLAKDYPNSFFSINYEHEGDEYKPCIIVMRQQSNQEANGEKKWQYPWANLKSKSISYINVSGYIYNFPLIILDIGVAKTVNNIIEAGGGLFNIDNQNNKGTFGCIVRKIDTECKELFLLTCYHCVKSNSFHNWDGIKPEDGNREVHYVPNLLDSNQIWVGNIESGYRDSRMDMAIIKPLENETISDYRWFSYMTVPLGSRAVAIEDLEQRTELWFSGLKSGNSKAHIINMGISAEILYDDGNKYQLNNLIIFSRNSNRPYVAPCDQGDSGAIIMDAKTYLALGMIVAKDDQFGYAIPIQDILTLHRLVLYTEPCKP
ncbi:MAG TPA: hypothetical protein VK590_10205 [Saprospiraceae bacterium]|nr:hypothetical protein [Saprospiraceae bacterium]